MFRFNEDTGYHQFNPIQFQETEKEYMLIGMILGLAIYNSINLDIAFPTVIFKKLLDYEGTFEVSIYLFCYGKCVLPPV